jgi:hypothetical protein
LGTHTSSPLALTLHAYSRLHHQALPIQLFQPIFPTYSSDYTTASARLTMGHQRHHRLAHVRMQYDKALYSRSSPYSSSLNCRQLGTPTHGLSPYAQYVYVNNITCRTLLSHYAACRESDKSNSNSVLIATDILPRGTLCAVLRRGFKSSWRLYMLMR